MISVIFFTFFSHIYIDLNKIVLRALINIGVLFSFIFYFLTFLVLIELK